MRFSANGAERRGTAVALVSRVRPSSFLLALIFFTCATTPAAEPPKILFAEDFEHGLSSAWKKVEFTKETQHTIRKEGTNSVLQARAENSASGLAVKLPNLQPERLVFRWRWKIDHIPPGGSDREISRFDHSARLFVAFKTLIGPPRTINYVWADERAVGETFEHPHSGRAQFLALESGNSKAGQWIQEERDLAADWKKLFGGDAPPAIVGLGLMTDSDGTKSIVTGWYDDFQILQVAREKSGK